MNDTLIIKRRNVHLFFYINATLKNVPIISKAMKETTIPPSIYHQYVIHVVNELIVYSSESWRRNFVTSAILGPSDQVATD